MATTPTLDQYPTDVARVTMDATPGNCEQITLPAWVRRVTLTFKQSDGSTADAGWLEFDATDGAAQLAVNRLGHSDLAELARAKVFDALCYVLR